MNEQIARIVGLSASNSMMCARGSNAISRGLGHRVELVLYKRRFWCLRCHKAFTESDSACGRYKRTTVRLREEIGKQACSRPIMHVATRYEVGPRFVQGCLETVARPQLAT